MGCRGWKYAVCLSLVIALVSLSFESQWVVQLSSHARTASPKGNESTLVRETHHHNRTIQHFKPSHRRPVLVLHVGPQKTGTTTIQCQLRQLDNILSQNSILLLETESCRPRGPTNNGQATYANVVDGQAWLPGCWLQWKPTSRKMPDCWQDSYVRLLREHSNQTIISNENLLKVFSTFRDNAPHFVRDLVRSLRQAGNYRLHVIATYRHWHEWVVSVYQERNKLLQSSRPKRMRWPGAGGEAVPTIVEALQQGDAKNQYVQRVVEFFRGTGERQRSSSRGSMPDVTLSILNFHAPPTLEYNFYCKALPGSMRSAFTLCQQHDNASNFGDSPQNQAKPVLIAYDSLAIEAYGRGWLPPKTGRETTIRFLQENVPSPKNPVSIHNMSAWPRECPDEQLYSTILEKSNRFLNDTLAAWLALGGDLRYQNNKTIYFGWDRAQFQMNLEQNYHKAVHSHRFCAIDAAATIQQDEAAWKNFFQGMAKKEDT